MLAIFWAIVSGICAAIAWFFWWRTRKAVKEMEAARTALRGIQEFWEWGAYTRIGVRDKRNHEFVTYTRVLDLFLLFKTGQVYENAKMLFQNEDFKVFAAGPRPKGE
jgi:hypothetical protein